MSFLVVLAVGVLATYVGLLLLLWRLQERIVFQPPASSEQTPVQARRVSFATADGIQLLAYVFGNYTSGATVVVAFHGNADLARWLAPWAVDVARADVCVVLPEYRGYDKLEGKPSYKGSALDAGAALQYVRDVMRVPPGDIVYFGHSLGSAIAAELAVVEPPRALVLQSPFSSANDMSRRFLFVAPTFLLTRLSRVHFDTVARVRELARPVWVAHGERDVIVPIRMGRAVFDAAQQKGELLVLPNAGHNDVAAAGGAVYMDWLVRAIGAGRNSDDATQGAREGTRSAP